MRACTIHNVYFYEYNSVSIQDDGPKNGLFELVKINKIPSLCVYKCVCTGLTIPNKLYPILENDIKVNELNGNAKIE